jgi:hypothetical protein
MGSRPYLEAEAARVGDLEPLRTLPVPTVTDTVLAELEYAAHLFQRLQAAVDSELAVLQGAGIRFVGYAPMRAGFDLADLGAQVRLFHMQAMQARDGRAI